MCCIEIASGVLLGVFKPPRYLDTGLGLYFRENMQRPSRLAKNMSTLKNWPPKSSKCHFSWNLRLAVPCRRITLQSLWNMLYESFFDAGNAFWWSLRLPSLKSGLKVEIWKIIIFIIFCVLYVRFWSLAEMVIPASPGALLLHALIKMLEVSGKTSKDPAGWPKIWALWKTDPRNLQNVIFHEI